jgi:hypothetical protein
LVNTLVGMAAIKRPFALIFLTALVFGGFI